MTGSFKKKNQNDVVLVKKTKSTGCNWIFYRVNLPGYTRFFLPLFFLQPGQFQPWIGRVLSQPPGRVSMFKSMKLKPKKTFYLCSQYLQFSPFLGILPIIKNGILLYIYRNIRRISHHLINH